MTRHTVKPVGTTAHRFRTIDTTSMQADKDSICLIKTSEAVIKYA